MSVVVMSISAFADTVVTNSPAGIFATFDINYFLVPRHRRRRKAFVIAYFAPVFRFANKDAVFAWLQVFATFLANLHGHNLSLCLAGFMGYLSVRHAQNTDVPAALVWSKFAAAVVPLTFVLETNLGLLAVFVFVFAIGHRCVGCKKDGHRQNEAQRK